MRRLSSLLFALTLAGCSSTGTLLKPADLDRISRDVQALSVGLAAHAATETDPTAKADAQKLSGLAASVGGAVDLASRVLAADQTTPAPVTK